MGLRVSVYRRGNWDSTNGGVSGKVSDLTVINIDGPFEPTDDAPAVVLVEGALNTAKIVPVDAVGQWTMFGGNYAACSDSRFSDAVAGILGHRFYGAVAIHDRIEG